MVSEANRIVREKPRLMRFPRETRGHRILREFETKDGFQTRLYPLPTAIHCMRPHVGSVPDRTQRDMLSTIWVSLTHIVQNLAANFRMDFDLFVMNRNIVQILQNESLTI